MNETQNELLAAVDAVAKIHSAGWMNRAGWSVDTNGGRDSDAHQWIAELVAAWCEAVVRIVRDGADLRDVELAHDQTVDDVLYDKPVGTWRVWAVFYDAQLYFTDCPAWDDYCPVWGDPRWDKLVEQHMPPLVYFTAPAEIMHASAVWACQWLGRAVLDACMCELREECCD